jgi:excisionase family DNA binding protein
MNRNRSTFNALDRNEELRKNPPQIMNAKELSVYLGISERKIRSDAAVGLLPSVRLGGRVVFRLSDLNKALEKNGKGVSYE